MCGGSSVVECSFAKREAREFNSPPPCYIFVLIHIVLGGWIAQLGERSIHNREVRGSIPFLPTIIKLLLVVECRERSAHTPFNITTD